MIDYDLDSETRLLLHHERQQRRARVRSQALPRWPALLLAALAIAALIGLLLA